MVLTKDNQICQRNTESLLGSPETDPHVEVNQFTIKVPLQLSGEMTALSINSNELDYKITCPVVHYIHTKNVFEMNYRVKHEKENNKALRKKNIEKYFLRSTRTHKTA